MAISGCNLAWIRKLCLSNLCLQHYRLLVPLMGILSYAFILFLLTLYSRGLRAGRLRNWDSIPGKGKRFICSPQRSYRLWTLPSLLSNEHQALFLQWLGRGAGHSPPSGADDKNGALPPLPSYVLMAWCLINYKDNFTVCLICITFVVGVIVFTFHMQIYECM
jgi:hypothetical protein